MPKIVDKDEVRSRILDASMTVYGEVGVHAATIDAIAKASDMGKGTLYLYFKGKDALTVALADRLFADLADAFMGHAQYETLEDMQKHLKTAMDIPKDRANFVRAFFEVFGPSFASEAFVKSVADFFDRVGTYYTNQIIDLQKRGHISKAVEPKATGRALAAIVDGIIIHKGLFGISTARHRRMIGASLHLFCEGLRAR